jgi:hypothetical protein
MNFQAHRQTIVAFSHWSIPKGTNPKKAMADNKTYAIAMNIDHR